MDLWVFVTEAVASDEEVQKHREAHLRRQVELEKAGILFAAGPLVHPDGTYARAGMVVIRAETAEEAKKIADADPMHVNGVRKYRLHKWLVHEGRINVSVDVSDQSSRIS